MVTREALEAWLHLYLSVGTVHDALPNGLQIEGKRYIKKIVSAVSINLSIIETAIAAHADALLVHHGLFWKTDDVTLRGYRRERIKRILDHDLNLFAYHLPLDFHPEISHNRLILKSLRADRIEEPEEWLQESGVSRVPAGGAPLIGLIGIFQKAVALHDLIARINTSLDTEARSFLYGKKQITSLWVISGAGRNELDTVLDFKVDAYLTGDAKESTPYIAREAGTNYIYAGHYNTERPGIISLGKKIEEKFGIEVQFVDITNPL